MTRIHANEFSMAASASCLLRIRTNASCSSATPETIHAAHQRMACAPPEHGQPRHRQETRKRGQVVGRHILMANDGAFGVSLGFSTANSAKIMLECDT